MRVRGGELGHVEEGTWSSARQVGLVWIKNDQVPAARKHWDVRDMVDGVEAQTKLAGPRGVTHLAAVSHPLDGLKVLG